MQTLWQELRGEPMDRLWQDLRFAGRGRDA